VERRLRTRESDHQEQPEYSLCRIVSFRTADGRKNAFRELAEKGTIMQYQKPQLHFIGNASKLIQTKGSDVIDVDIPGHAKFGLFSKLEEE
jgi:hypothetical protein